MRKLDYQTHSYQFKPPKDLWDKFMDKLRENNDSALRVLVNAMKDYIKED